MQLSIPFEPEAQAPESSAPDTAPLSEEALLFGADPTEGVVAAEVRESGATLYLREEGGVRARSAPFRPWLLTRERLDLADAEWTRLEGEGYCWLAELASPTAFTAARRALRDAHTAHFAYASLVKQLLVWTGVTLFKGMDFDGPVRLQLDLETASLSPNAPESRILLAAISDNRGGEVLLSGSEVDILQGIVETVRRVDPDVIEGHNLLGFDLPYLTARASQLGVPLRLGRDGSPIAFGSERGAAIGGISRPFTPAYIHGRHLIDTLLASQRYDWVRGVMESYSLKEVARVLQLSQTDRILLDRADVTAELERDPERVREYALQDVRETAAISRVVGATDFYVTQMVPDSYQSVATGGTGEKVESLLVRAYLGAGAAIPQGQPSRPYPGGYTECRATGVLRDVLKVDVESLYPSLMLTRRIAPASDRLGCFLPMLSALTRRRLEAKAKVRGASGSARAYWDGLQSSFKILINSFYGYLAGPFSFNDYEAAEAVTRGGQEVVLAIAARLEESGSRVIEIDTDGVYFQPPAGLDREADRERYVAQIGASLPKGIRLAYEGHYPAMVSLKMKNYVLVDESGKLIFHGSALRSRSDEPFGRRFISEVVKLLVEGKLERAAEVYRDTLVAIQSGRLPPEQFARRERVTEATFQGPQAKRWADLHPRLKVGDYVHVYRREGGNLALVEEYAGDEDRGYLVDKLYKFVSRLREAVGSDFDRLFPKPMPTADGGTVALQGTLDFG